jgi:hypothetical protein
MPSSVQAEFSYLEWQQLYDTEKPFELFVNLSADTSDHRRTNLVFKKHEPEIMADVRGRQDVYQLDTHGFKFATHPTKVIDFSDVTNVEQDYFAETVELIKLEVEGADKVVIFDWMVSVICMPEYIAYKCFHNRSSASAWTKNSLRRKPSTLRSPSIH